MIQAKNELLGMLIDMVVFALENNIATLPTGETPTQLLSRIAGALKESEEPVTRRGRRRKDEEQPAAAE